MKLEDVQDVSRRGSRTCFVGARISVEMKEWLEKNGVNVRILIETAAKELGYNPDLSTTK